MSDAQVPDRPRPPASPIPLRPGQAGSVRAPRRRRWPWGLRAGFLALVLLPALMAALYLFLRAADQYAATAGFAVQSARPAPSIDLLGGLSQLSGASDTQAAMVYAYLESPDLVATLDRQLDLRARFSRADDPIFALDPGASRERLIAYWQGMTRTSYDTGTGLITLQVRAFSAEDAQSIAAAAYAAASRMINAISTSAQADMTRAARAELGRAESRLRAAQRALDSFREQSRVVDPAADVSGQMGLIGSLQDALAQALIDRDLLAATTGPADPRLAEAERRISAIRSRIAAERRGLGSGGPHPGATLARLTGRFEQLTADRAFAETSYEAARAAVDAAEAAARQQAIYLAAWQNPVRPESAEYPRRWQITALVALFGFLVWSILSLAYYSLRDRR